MKKLFSFVLTIVLLAVFAMPLSLATSAAGQLPDFTIDKLSDGDILSPYLDYYYKICRPSGRRVSEDDLDDYRFKINKIEGGNYVSMSFKYDEDDDYALFISPHSGSVYESDDYNNDRYVRFSITC